MEPRLTYRNMESSPTIEKYVHEKIKKIDKMLQKEPSPKKLDVIIEAHRQRQHHQVELRLHSAHYHFIASQQGNDLYACVDFVFDELLREIRTAKEKRVDARKIGIVSRKIES